MSVVCGGGGGAVSSWNGLGIFASLCADWMVARQVRSLMELAGGDVLEGELPVKKYILTLPG